MGIPLQHRRAQLQFTTVDLVRLSGLQHSPKWYVNVVSNVSTIIVDAIAYTLTPAFGSFIGRIEVQPGQHQVTSLGLFQAVLYGFSHYQAYAYSGGWDTLLIPVGLDSPLEEDLLFYPNPTVGGEAFHILSSTSENLLLQIYTLQGVKVLEDNIQFGLNEYYLKFPPGIYLLIAGKRKYLLSVY